MSKTKPEEYVSAEVALHPQSKENKVLEGDEWILPGNVKNYIPAAENVGAAVKGLRDLGFQILEVGAATVTIVGEPALFEKHCKVKLKMKSKTVFDSKISEEKVSFYSPPEGEDIVNSPDNVKQYVEGIVIPEPPIFFAAAIAPNPSPPYLNLHPAGDIPMIMRANRLHAMGYVGKGVKLAVVDTGCDSDHPYYVSRGYNVYTVGTPIPGVTPDTDENGHGTAIATNALGVAPGINMVSIKMGVNPTLAFKLAVRQRPQIITNSWGYDIDFPPPSPKPLPPFLIPLELEVANAVAKGITVLFAAGNGHRAFPGCMPEVIAVGGGHYDQNLNLKASNYASSFDSVIYPGRHVPDICGPVGLDPRGIYIMMPTQPGSAIDVSLSGGAFPNGDQTPNNDGWACASGTSSATPAVAGVVALLLEKKPTLAPDEVKAILEGTAIDIVNGSSNMDPAGVGWDRATGHGFVDAYEAWRSIP